MNTISDSDIIKQLHRICSNEDFATKKLLCEFLRFVVTETLHGRSNQLKGYTIGREVLGKDVDFDPEQDSIVSIHASRLRRSLKMYYLEQGKNDPVKIHIPIGTYVPIVSLNCKETVNVQQSHKLSGKIKDLPISPTLTVLNFENLTGDPNKEYFSRGFPLELSVGLTRFEDLMVYNLVGLNESAEDRSKLIKRLKSKGVHFFIEGAIQQDSKHLNILIRLNDCYSDRQIWAENFQVDHPIQSILELQDDLIENISVLLAGEYGIILQKLSGDAKRNKPNISESFHALLKFYCFEANLSPETTSSANEAISKALKKDPESGLLTSLMLALHLKNYSLDNQGASESYKLLDDLANKAIENDSNSMMVKIMFASKLYFCNNFDCFRIAADECLQMIPKGPFRFGTLAFLIALGGEWEKGKKLLDQILKYNTGFPKYFYVATFLYYYRTGDYKNAFNESLKFDMPAFFWSAMLRIAVYGKLKKQNEARLYIDQLSHLKPDFKEKAHYLVSRYVKEEELVQDVLDGLRMAGMKL